jgi:hypothetical protein
MNFKLSDPREVYVKDERFLADDIADEVDKGT